MHAIHRPLPFVLWGAILCAVGTAMAAEASPPVRLQMPFLNAFTHDDVAAPQLYSEGNCTINGEQGLRIERNMSDPCLAADASAGGACFDRLGLGALQSRRPLLPRRGLQNC
jgi:hypothetical protein